MLEGREGGKVVDWRGERRGEGRMGRAGMGEKERGKRGDLWSGINLIFIPGSKCWNCFLGIWILNNIPWSRRRSNKDTNTTTPFSFCAILDTMLLFLSVRQFVRLSFMYLNKTLKPIVALSFSMGYHLINRLLSSLFTSISLKIPSRVLVPPQA